MQLAVQQPNSRKPQFAITMTTSINQYCFIPFKTLSFFKNKTMFTAIGHIFYLIPFKKHIYVYT